MIARHLAGVRGRGGGQRTGSMRGIPGQCVVLWGHREWDKLSGVSAKAHTTAARREKLNVRKCENHGGRLGAQDGTEHKKQSASHVYAVPRQKAVRTGC